LHINFLKKDLALDITIGNNCVEKKNIVRTMKVVVPGATSLPLEQRKIMGLTSIHARLKFENKK